MWILLPILPVWALMVVFGVEPWGMALAWAVVTCVFILPLSAMGIVIAVAAYADWRAGRGKKDWRWPEADD